ncbi:nuclear hormone receptor HR96-like [Gigantopelta aegis]|uniref:nuclear hormone receptor HR96-like n=1 Tax=Gigantopelta aegis TaxID=1735272 RepID=UPI001B88811C|nr:nuclear hormone receptor HR96-like [Gigantopelta aegis]
MDDKTDLTAVKMEDDVEGAASDASTSQPDMTVTSASAGKKDKICLVCGDRALGYNFNAVSCESCKAFFRRNAHKTIRGRCEGKCDVNVESRSFCKRCRLAKCFTVGMRRDMILNDEQKRVRKQKIVINKLRRHGQVPDGSYPELTPDILAKAKTLLSGDGSNLPFSIAGDSNYLLSLKNEFLNQGSSCCSNSSTESVSKPPPWSESQELVSAAIDKLKDTDQKVIEEVLRAHKISSFLSETTTSLKVLPTNPTEFINVAEGFVRRIIKFAKNIDFFKKLCKEDQIVLLKSSVVDIMMLRSAVNFDPYTETWSLSTLSCLSGPGSSSGSQSAGIADKISAEVLKSGSAESAKLFITYSKFIKSLMTTIHGDLVILKVLILMSLFSADRGNLMNQKQVMEIQESYAGVLQNYTQLRFPDEKTMFARIVMKLTDLRNINEVHTKMLLTMKIDDIEPLLVEIFDPSLATDV